MTDPNAETQDESNLSLSDFQACLERCVAKLSGRVKHCGRNSFAHLRTAWSIRRIDPAMAAFRAITAEEEAASALLLSLRQKGYPNSSRLNHRDHIQKSALTPFLNAVAQVLDTAQFAKPNVILSEGDPEPSVNIQIDMRAAGLAAPGPLFGTPDQPLNFSIRHGLDGEVNTFKNELDQIARNAGVDKLTKFIKAEANNRNRLLYAGDTGIPKVEFEDGFLHERLRRVTVLLVLTIAIQQTNMHQLFAVQCLHAFLLALEKIDAAEIEFAEAETPNGRVVSVIHDGESEPKAWIGWRWNFEVPLVYSIEILAAAEPPSPTEIIRP